MIKNIALAVLALFCLYLFFRPSEKVKVVVPEVVKEYVNIEVGRVNANIDKKGFEHAVIDEVENVISDKNQLDDSSRRQLDSVTNQLAIKSKQLKHYISYSATLEGKLLQASRTDTSFRYSDSWANIEYVIAKDTTSRGHFNFKYNAEVSYAEYWKRKHFLAPKKHYIDFWINDPRATINGVKRVKIEPKPDKLGVEVSASSYYTDRLNIGFDGSVRVGRGRFGGGYFYDMLDGKWKPLISVKFNLLDL